LESSGLRDSEISFESGEGSGSEKNKTDIETENDGVSELTESDLRLRNRYLEGRVKYLEEEYNVVATPSDDAAQFDLPTMDSAEPQSSAEELSIVEANADIVPREQLEWRIKYLEGRVKFLEEDEMERSAILATRFQPDMAQTSASEEEVWVDAEILEEAQYNEAIHFEENSLELERLRWRNQYLEERLSFASLEGVKLSASAAAEPVRDVPEYTPTDPERSAWRELYWAERVKYNTEAQLKSSFKVTDVQSVGGESLDKDRLIWRDAYLNEKLNVIESESTKVEQGAQSTENDVSITSSVLADDTTDAHRLLWRDGYNQHRLKLVNAENSRRHENSSKRVRKLQTAHDKVEFEKHQLDWRQQYLAHRLKLEKSKNLDSELVAKTDAELLKAHRRNTYLEERIAFLEAEQASQTKETGSYPSEQTVTQRPGDALDTLNGVDASDAETSRSETSSSSKDSLDQPGSAAALAAALEKRERKTREAKPKKRRKRVKSSTSTSTVKRDPADSFAESFRTSEYFVEGDSKSGRPAYLTQPLLGQADELREIAGIGPKIEGILHGLGVYHFYQIAAWSRKEVEWVDAYLTFKGRIDRENWIEQAKKLARGEETDGQRKYRSGQHT
jgi:predicted flap endonuclease-1-like 5' DNA nuclease